MWSGKNNMRICVVIPALNEEGSIGQLVGNVLSYAGEVVVVDDGSTDDTCAIARDAGATVVRHPETLGKGAALRTGFDYVLKAGYDGVITMDADGQHDYRDVPVFISEAGRSDAGIILGTRMMSVAEMPLIRLLTNVVTSRIVSIISRQRVTDSQVGFRFIRREVLEAVNLTTANYETESEILIKASRKGFRISEIPVKTIYGKQSSNINAFIDTLRFIKLVLREGLSVRRQ